MSPNYNIGSVVADVTKMIPDIPTSISGTEMNSLVIHRINYINSWTGLGIGSIDISETHQPPLVNLTASDVARSMLLEGSDSLTAKIGDFSQSKGKESHLATAGETFEQRGMEALKILGRNTPYGKANG